jgi:hypothetical protein
MTIDGIEMEFKVVEVIPLLGVAVAVVFVELVALFGARLDDGTELTAGTPIGRTATTLPTAPTVPTLPIVLPLLDLEAGLIVPIVAVVPKGLAPTILPGTVAPGLGCGVAARPTLIPTVCGVFEEGALV